jgi:uncharacterized protein with FMN-binding domain
MKKFWIRLSSLAMVVLIFLGYNTVLDVRGKEEEIASLQAQLETAALQTEETVSATNYQDGVYEGEAEGFGGIISLEVVISDGVLTEIKLLSAEQEDGAYLSMAQDIIPTIIEHQSADVDTISGATFSSTGIKNAVQEALQKATE